MKNIDMHFVPTLVSRNSKVRSQILQASASMGGCKVISNESMHDMNILYVMTTEAIITIYI